MSVSTLPTTNRFRSKARRKTSPAWWCLSLLFHGGAFVALVTLTPIKNVVIPPALVIEQAEQNRIEHMQGEKVEAVAEHILELRTEDARASVEELKRIRDELAKIESAKREEFEKATGTPIDIPPSGNEQKQEQAGSKSNYKGKGTNASMDNLTNQNMGDLYESARDMENSITDIYRNIRAAQLAMIRKMSFAEAVKITDVVKPPRPDIDRTALEEKIRNGKDFLKYEKELQKVSQELGDMVALANNLQSTAQGMTEEGKEGMNISGDLAKEMANALGNLEGQAGAIQGQGDIKDMTGLMEDAYNTTTAVLKKNASRTKNLKGLESGDQEGTLSTGDAAGGSARGIGTAGGAGTGGTGGAGGNGAGDAGTGGGGGGAGGAGTGGTGGDGDGGGIATSGQRGNRLGGASTDGKGGGTPYPFKSDASIKFTRSITNDGDPADWLFLDSWYVIGPFPNPERKNINKLFPPETVIDLDASYEGMTGQMVRWQFMQTGTPALAPPRTEEYAIYYFYTELRSDEPRDIWLLIGSDDQSKLWINNQQVWKSADILKGWKIDEGYRKVRLVKGVNKILVRLENGWLFCSVSLGFATRPMK